MASKASSTASRAGGDPSDTLESELASLIRVRNRLAMSKDEALPKILTGLLPRVLSKLEATYQQQNEDNNTQFVRSQIRGHLMGILMHALERIRGNSDMSVPWMSDVAVSLESKSGVVRMLALSFLQAAVPRCRDSREAIPMASLLKAVDQCYRRQEEGSEAGRLELRTASWLLLDAIAIVSGLVPMVDWDLDCFNEEGRLGVYEPPKEAANTLPIITPESIETVSRDGIGVWDLMLDVLLFWPTSPPRRQWPLENNRAAEATSGGISLEGRGRMAFRLKDRSWNDMAQGYLRCLKAACFNFCVSKEHPCIFQGEDGSVGATRALMLSVMLANVNSMVGKHANDYVNVHFSEQRTSAFGVLKQHSVYSLSMACSLLVLVLGDAASTPVVEQYPSQQHLWVDILGTRPSGTSTMRSPLPPPMSARIIEFISDRLVVAKAIADDSVEALKLFVDLAVTVQKNHVEDGLWAIRLVYGLQKQVEQMNDAEWMEDFRTKCITCAKDTLAGLPDPSVSRPIGIRDDTEEPVNRLIARRRAEDDLFAKHRNSLRKKRLRYDDALKARENAYELIGTLGYLGTRVAQGDCEHEELSFELPIVLFKCALFEDTMMKPRATKALSDLLSSFTSAVSSGTFDESSLQRQAAYLIPSLVNASCCEFEAVRLASAQWTTSLLWLIDPPAAYCLCCFLANDTDLKVSILAKSIMERKAIEKLSLVDDAVQQPMYEFLDLSTDQDRATLTMELEVRISAITQSLNIPSSAASVILLSFDGYPKEAIDACAMDREGVFRRCGVEARCRISNDDLTRDCDMDGNFVCGICYNDEIAMSDSYAMSCGHRFCTACYKSFLENAIKEGPNQILNATCPSHDCIERITGVEVSELIPEQLEKWKDYFLRQFVEQESHYRFCTGPDCDVVVVSLGDTGPVTCICDTTFCFGCGELPHVPALCEDFEKWQKIFGSSVFWVAKHTKPCPNCGVPIEKNQGCNHIRCSQCQFDFCWICLAHLDTHMMAHTCNQYDPAAHAEDDDVKMRLFFTDRFQAHEEAELFARKRLEGIEDKVQHLLDKFWLLEEKEAQDLVKGEETLVEARRFLKYSFIAAYGMKDDKSRRKVFESHQGALELLTETLSGLTELNLDTMYVERGENSLRLHLRAITFYTSIIEKYMERIANLNYGTVDKL